LAELVVWVPKSFAGQKNIEAKRFGADPRTEQFWDEGGRLMRAYSTTLGLKVDAWDIFLVYRPGTTWTDAPPKSEPRCGR
jgi:hypothetical protein